VGAGFAHGVEVDHVSLTRTRLIRCAPWFILISDVDQMQNGIGSAAGNDPIPVRAIEVR